MRVSLGKYPNSYVLNRIVKALKDYAPSSIEFSEDADITILHVNGRYDKILRTKTKRYAIIQYALQSTQRPDPVDWLPIWQGADLVWSYYDLPGDFNLYHAPLGVEKHFRPYNIPKRYVAMSSGLSYLSESVREVHKAAKQVGKRAVHLGPEMNNLECINGITDNELSRYYSQCEFVSGLRRKDGFELPAAEGLVCGARPILFDRPHYRQWYNDWGIFIPENSRPEVISNLVRIFNEGAKPVTNKEIASARMLFDWQQIVEGFWTRLITS